MSLPSECIQREREEGGREGGGGREGILREKETGGRRGVRSGTEAEKEGRKEEEY